MSNLLTQRMLAARPALAGAPTDTGWIPFNSIASFTSVAPGTAWSNPGSALLNDGTSTDLNNSSGNTAFLHCQNLSATGIPSGSLILGMEMRFERKTLVGVAADNNIRIIRGGAVNGDNKSLVAVWAAGTNEDFGMFGGPTDLWNVTGAALTGADVNAADFGVSIQANNSTSSFTIFNIDIVEMKIHYAA